MDQSFSVNRLIKIVRKPAFWLIVVLFVLTTFLHYREVIELPAFIADFIITLGISRHAFERIFYMALIIWSGFLFGWSGNISVTVIAVICMMPRVFLLSEVPVDALIETIVVVIIGNSVAFTSESLHRDRESRILLSIQNEIASATSQFLELDKVLESSVNNIMDLLKVDIVQLFLIEEQTRELYLAASKGISEKSIEDLQGLQLGEGFNGIVARTGESLYIENAATDSRLTRKSVIEREGMRSLLIVALKARGKVLGTLCIATHRTYIFTRNQVKILTAVGNQIGIALENARLYEKEREFGRELRMSEEKYRQLFENANDAIWINDINGNIISANDAAYGLVDGRLESLSHTSNMSQLSNQSLILANEIRTKLLRGETVSQPYEQKLIMADGISRILKLTTNIFNVDGKPVGFQHIARDVTLEMKMQDNLRFYLEQVTRAQESERMRIARELHDDTIQALIALSRELDIISSSKDGISEEKRQLLKGLRAQTNNAMAGVRRLSQDLRPPTLDRLGLVAALEWLASSIENRYGITINVKRHGVERRFSTEVELLLFRITQEAIGNVWKHAGATQAEIIVEFDDQKTKITIKDNGKGFEVPASLDHLTKYGKLGLTGMQERARLIGGSLAIKSQRGNGTIVIVEVPQ